MKRIILSLSIVLAAVMNMQAETKDYPVDFSVDGFEYQIVANHGSNVYSVWVSDDEEPYKTGTVTIPTTVSYEGKYCVVTAINYYWPMENGLTKLIVPIGIDTIQKNAFNLSSTLQEIDIPYIKYIGAYAFSMTGIKQLNLSGANLKYLGEGCFGLNKQMTKVTITAPQLKELPKFAFDYCEKLATVNINTNITKIGEQAFSNNKTIQKITLPASLKSMGDNVFWGDDNLKEIKCLATTPPTCTTKTFDGLDKTKVKVIVPAGTAAKYKKATGWKDLKISDGTEAVENVSVHGTTVKTIENGQVLIHAGEKTYTVTGQEVR